MTNEKSHIAPSLSQPATKVTTTAPAPTIRIRKAISNLLYSLGLRTASVNAQSNQLGIQLFRAAVTFSFCNPLIREEGRS